MAGSFSSIFSTGDDGFSRDRDDDGSKPELEPRDTDEASAQGDTAAASQSSDDALIGGRGTESSMADDGLVA